MMELGALQWGFVWVLQPNARKLLSSVDLAVICLMPDWVPLESLEIASIKACDWAAWIAERLPDGQAVETDNYACDIFCVIDERLRRVGFASVELYDA